MFEEFDEHYSKESGLSPGTDIWLNKKTKKVYIESTRIAREVGFVWPVVLTDRAWKTAIAEECRIDLTGDEPQNEAMLDEQTKSFLQRVHQELSAVDQGTKCLRFKCWLQAGLTNIVVAVSHYRINHTLTLAIDID